MKKLTLLSLAFVPCFLLAQENYISHTVSKGETLYQISRKYNVKIGEINQLNPTLNADLIYPEQIILIPRQTTPPLRSQEQDTEYTYHTVEAGETKFGLQRKFGLSIADLEKDNPQIVPMLRAGERIRIRKSKNTTIETVVSTADQKDESTHEVVAGETLYAISRKYYITLNQLIQANKTKLGEFLQIGQILVIPKDVDSRSVSFENKNTHIVERGETKYGLSKKFNTTIAELEQLNPHIVRMLRTGDQIILPVQNTDVAQVIVNQEPVQVESKPKVEKETHKTSVTTTATYSDYIIQPKETLYSLSKKAQLSQEELLELNPILHNAVQAGVLIQMPDSVVQEIEPTQQQTIAQEDDQREKPVVVEAEKPAAQLADLSKTIQAGQTKKVMFLLPFTSVDFQSYQDSGIAKESESFMQFYSGALTALDSIKKLGVNIELEFVNSTIDINSIKRQFSIHKPDVIIGSYHQNQIIADNSVPFIYPFTADFQVDATSFYRAVPSDLTRAKILLDYIRSKNGNLIVISDIEKTADKEFIAQSTPDAKFAHLTDRTTPDTENLKSLLEKDKKNYILLNTDRTPLFLNLTTILLNEISEYDLQLAVIQEVPKDVAPIRLRLLKTLYVSLTDQNESNTTTFHKKYTKENKKQVTPEVLRGFDVTYDVLLRMTQTEGFEQTLEQYKTKQIQLEFDYTRDAEGKFSNTAAQLLHYDTDSNTKKTN